MKTLSHLLYGQDEQNWHQLLCGYLKFRTNKENFLSPTSSALLLSRLYVSFGEFHMTASFVFYSSTGTQVIVVSAAAKATT